MNENRRMAPPPGLRKLLVSLLFIAFVSAVSAQIVSGTVRKTEAFNFCNNSRSVVINGLTIDQYARTANGNNSIDLGGNM